MVQIIITKISKIQSGKPKCHLFNPLKAQGQLWGRTYPSQRCLWRSINVIKYGFWRFTKFGKIEMMSKTSMGIQKIQPSKPHKMSKKSMICYQKTKGKSKASTTVYFCFEFLAFLFNFNEFKEDLKKITKLQFANLTANRFQIGYYLQKALFRAHLFNLRIYWQFRPSKLQKSRSKYCSRGKIGLNLGLKAQDLILDKMDSANEKLIFKSIFLLLFLTFGLLIKVPDFLDILWVSWSESFF